MGKYLCLCALIGTALFLPAARAADEPTPAPATGQQFALPLSNQTTAAAIILPGRENTHWLVYATPNGQLAAWQLSPPGPSPEPQPTPPPPTPGPLRLAIVENPTTTTPLQRGIIANPAWRNHIPSPHIFIGAIDSQIIDPQTHQPPEELRPFLTAAAGHALPCVVLLADDGQVYRVVPLPKSAGEILTLFPNAKR
jgi:hypothetical protein